MLRLLTLFSLSKKTSSLDSPQTVPLMLKMKCPLFQQDIKFKILKTQPLSKILNAYIKLREKELDAYFKNNRMDTYLTNKANGMVLIHRTVLILLLFSHTNYCVCG